MSKNVHQCVRGFLPPPLPLGRGPRTLGWRGGSPEQSLTPPSLLQTTSPVRTRLRSAAAPPPAGHQCAHLSPRVLTWINSSTLQKHLPVWERDCAGVGWEPLRGRELKGIRGQQGGGGPQAQTPASAGHPKVARVLPQADAGTLGFPDVYWVKHARQRVQAWDVAGGTGQLCRSLPWPHTSEISCSQRGAWEPKSSAGGSPGSAAPVPLPRSVMGASPHGAPGSTAPPPAAGQLRAHGHGCVSPPLGSLHPHSSQVHSSPHAHVP